MQTLKTNRFKKVPSLKLKTEISTLFNKGKIQKYGLIKLIYAIEKATVKPELKVLVSVPKRLINQASKRNLLKRRIREAMRLNISQLRDLCFSDNLRLHIAIIYNRDFEEKYNNIEEKIVISLQNIYTECYEDNIET